MLNMKVVKRENPKSCHHKENFFVSLVLYLYEVIIQSVQSLSRVRLFAIQGLQHTILPCPSPTPRAYSNSCLSSW